MEIIRKCRGGNLLVETEEGERMVVDENWTAGPGDEKSEKQSKISPHLLAYEGLVQIVELIERIQERGLRMTSQTEEDYDGGDQKVKKSSEVES